MSETMTCPRCKGQMQVIGSRKVKETQAVERMVFYEDDAEMVVRDETFYWNQQIAKCENGHVFYWDGWYWSEER